jgi:hypothetical protein
LKIVDVLIFTTKESLPTALQQYEMLRDCKIYNVAVVCPDGCIVPREITVFRDESAPDFKFISEFTAKLERKRGWYRQQLLKLSFCFSSERDVLILDGDTLFSKQFLRNLVSGELAYTKENVAHYNLFFKDIDCDLPVREESFITNCMYYPVELNSNKLISIRELCELILSSRVGDFSEYQFIAIARIYYGLYSRLRPMRLFRRADLLFRRIERPTRYLSERGYDGICFEKNHDGGLVKRILAEVALIVGYVW